MVATKGIKYPDRELYDYVLNELDERNINEQTIGEIAYKMQHQYLPELTIEDFGRELKEVLKKREVLNILATGFALDNLANTELLPEPLQTIIANDEGVYGVDETIALALSQLYGSIATTNYGYTDKEKVGVAKELDNTHGHVNTFADDLALALASAVIGRCGHGSKLDLENTNEFDTEDFEEFLQTAIANGLANHLEEVIEHDYYVDMHLDKELPKSLEIEFRDNAFNLQHLASVNIDVLQEYIVKYIVNHANEDATYYLAQLIVDYLMDNDLYVAPEEENDSDIVDEALKKLSELASSPEVAKAFNSMFDALLGGIKEGGEKNE